MSNLAPGGTAPGGRLVGSPEEGSTMGFRNPARSGSEIMPPLRPLLKTTRCKKWAYLDAWIHVSLNFTYGSPCHNRSCGSQHNIPFTASSRLRIIIAFNQWNRGRLGKQRFGQKGSCKQSIRYLGDCHLCKWILIHYKNDIYQPNEREINK